MISAFAVLACLASVQGAEPAELLAGAVRHADQYYAKVASEPIKQVGSRDLFSAALAYAVAGQHLDRLERLFTVAASLQDRQPESRTYGNFRWHSTAQQVEDLNAVDFCMQPGAVLLLEHREQMPPAARALFDELIRHGVEGSLRHRVTPSYTNIALMNAGNLILLGEGLGRPEVTAEGRARLDRVVLDIWEHGIHEYGSPTYYGVDLHDLVVLERLTRDDATRQVARALLELFWSDIAANWHLGAGKYTGARSRDYDYLRGLGILDLNLWVEGWLADSSLKPSLGTLIPLLAKWIPSVRVEQLRHRYPRLVRQRWGAGPTDVRSHYLLPEVALGTAGRTYGNMDIPLAVDFAGPRQSVRAYFIADARHDPYGKLKVPAGGGHDKTIHLTPMWTAAQAGGDALGLVVYRPKDIPEGASSLESHLVLPRAVDALYVGEQQQPIGAPFECEVPAGSVVTLRRGTAAASFRLLWARDSSGQAARTMLVDDGNPHGALRLTTTHGIGPQPYPAAAYWVRVGSSLDEAALTTWRREFEAARPSVAITPTGVTLSAAAPAGELRIEALVPYEQAPRLLPAPSPAVLEVDGQEIGRPLLEPL
ncbi:MAG: hypothetical protein HUU35_04845, partial [Armatimonadetes bacterium]|nr:hypothetical protein [Armatimonadota bacterium]